MNHEELKKVLHKHKLWLWNEGGGRANLRGANLRGANLRGANLREADLSRADLREADLREADLRETYLRETYLGRANLNRASLNRAKLSMANLSRANLAHSDLKGSTLFGANMWGVQGNNNKIKSIHCEVYDIAYTSHVLQIGCEQHNIEQWWGFSDREIKCMDGKKALDWWKVWKPILQNIIAVSPATDD
jgi:hypothetical protein